MAIAASIAFSGCMAAPTANQPGTPSPSGGPAPADFAGNQAPRLIDTGTATATPGPNDVAGVPDLPRSEGLHDLAVVAPRPALAPFEATGPYAIFNRAPDLVPFASRSLTGTDFDVFIYDQAGGTVLVPPGINTAANEVDPRVSTNGRWLVYSTDADGQGLAIHMLDVGLGQIDTLSTLNTGVPSFGPAVDDTGRLVAFRVRANARDQLRLYSLVSQRTFVPPTLNAFQDGQLSDFTLAPTGTVVALTVTPDANAANQDIYVYDLEAGALGTLPYLNTAAVERQPYFSSDGAKLLFTSNRGGHDHVYMADLVTHFVDPLPLLNSANGNERSPRFLGLGQDRIVFESDRAGIGRVFVYDRATGVIDTLPIANQVGSETLLNPVVPSPSPSPSPSVSPSPSPSPSTSPTPTPTPTPTATPTP